ncbi:transcriptional regulator [Pedobacter ginsenosidimutans]|uniref:Transcriptional regulator n=1 Tax=Pedobacter ginsenosidimutans TaxID=687842 RepID=A0A0T5VVG7_9SPHI|nr:hydrogen peroxide-inducible genes activator [Pedobacter ginsenosidimutans]KRT17863.1 transcriptional regulator [Pedobacter ginsenosidimutans]
MTIVQLKYIVAVDTYRHFALAAEKCYVSQPTMSMQIQKAEEEIGAKIFDRSKQPVIPTELGTELIEQARKILSEVELLDHMVQIRLSVISGQLRIGIIPTLAPYLLPLFIKPFTTKYPRVKLIISEHTTEMMTSSLISGKIDIGILATPLQQAGIKEYPLFYEKLLAYVSKNNGSDKKNYILAKDIDPKKLWLLEEGHCFRSQIMNLCALKHSIDGEGQFIYESGSIETLRRMIDINDGITIIPELATINMNEEQMSQVRYFAEPSPVREISIVVHRDYIKKKLIAIVSEEIMLCLPENVRANINSNTIPVTQST